MKRTGLLVLLLIAPLPAHAQHVSCKANPTTCSLTPQQIEITIGPVLRLELSPTPTSLTAPTAAHYNAGLAATTGPTATIKSNAPWTLAISASTAVWSANNTGSEVARDDKPATDLGWSTAAGGPFTPLTTTPAAIATGSATLATAVSLFYRTQYSWAFDTPGDYSIQIVFTITSP